MKQTFVALNTLYGSDESLTRIVQETLAIQSEFSGQLPVYSSRSAHSIISDELYGIIRHGTNAGESMHMGRLLRFALTMRQSVTNALDDPDWEYHFKATSRTEGLALEYILMDVLRRIQIIHRDDPHIKFGDRVYKSVTHRSPQLLDVLGIDFTHRTFLGRSAQETAQDITWGVQMTLGSYTGDFQELMVRKRARTRNIARKLARPTARQHLIDQTAPSFIPDSTALCILAPTQTYIHSTPAMIALRDWAHAGFPSTGPVAYLSSSAYQSIVEWGAFFTGTANNIFLFLTRGVELVSTETTRYRISPETGEIHVSRVQKDGTVTAQIIFFINKRASRFMAQDWHLKDKIPPPQPSEKRRHVMDRGKHTKYQRSRYRQRIQELFCRERSQIDDLF